MYKSSLSVLHSDRDAKYCLKMAQFWHGSWISIYRISIYNILQCDYLKFVNLELLSPMANWVVWGKKVPDVLSFLIHHYH